MSILDGLPPLHVRNLFNENCVLRVGREHEHVHRDHLDAGQELAAILADPGGTQRHEARATLQLCDTHRPEL